MDDFRLVLILSILLRLSMSIDGFSDYLELVVLNMIHKDFRWLFRRSNWPYGQLTAIILDNHKMKTNMTIPCFYCFKIIEKYKLINITSGCRPKMYRYYTNINIIKHLTKVNCLICQKKKWLMFIGNPIRNMCIA